MADDLDKDLYGNENLIYSKADGIAKITLNNPATLNSITLDMENGVRAALLDAQHDSSIRVVILTGAGRAFCSGANVKNWSARLEAGGQAPDPAANRTASARASELRNAMMCMFQEINKTTIAMVNGVAVGQGADMAFACDMRIASEEGKFGMFYVRRGLIPLEGGSWFLTRLVGPAKAIELLQTGDLIDGREAERIGLVNKCVPHAELEAATMELARKIADGPPLALMYTKKLVYQALQGSLRDTLNTTVIAGKIIGESEDVKEGMKAATEKRKPIFVGR